MGRFVNPDNSAFRKALNSEIYVDKTGFWNIRILDMIRYTIRHLYQTRNSARNYRKQYGEKKES